MKIQSQSIPQLDKIKSISRNRKSDTCSEVNRGHPERTDLTYLQRSKAESPREWREKPNGIRELSPKRLSINDEDYYTLDSYKKIS